MITSVVTRNAVTAVTLELAVGARVVGTRHLVRVITAVVLGVAAPIVLDAETILTPKKRKDVEVLAHS